MEENRGTKAGRHRIGAAVCVAAFTLWQVSYPALLAMAHSRFAKAGAALKENGGQISQEIENLRESWISINEAAKNVQAYTQTTSFFVAMSVALLLLIFFCGRKWTARVTAVSLAVSLATGLGLAYILSSIQQFAMVAYQKVLCAHSAIGTALALGLAMAIYWLMMKIRGEKAQ